MKREPTEVANELRERIGQGYRPTYTNDSACDHGADWFALTKEEFDDIVRSGRELSQAAAGSAAGRARKRAMGLTTPPRRRANRMSGHRSGRQPQESR